MEIDGHEIGLGRVPSPTDTRDGLHPMRAALQAVVPQVVPKYRYWTPGPVLNQGATPHCVGFAWAQWESTSPIRQRRDWAGDTEGHSLYARCKEIDGIPDIDGTYVRVGAKVLDRAGHVERYVWANSLADMTEWLLLHGPVVVGTMWTQSMFRPDPVSGRLSVIGDSNEGHAYLIRGYSRDRKEFRMVNSWGTWWGQNGQAWIGEDDMWRLVSQTGEAVAAIERVLKLG